jgi:hypothetical protein
MAVDLLGFNFLRRYWSQEFFYFLVSLLRLLIHRARRRFPVWHVQRVAIVFLALLALLLKVLCNWLDSYHLGVALFADGISQLNHFLGCCVH